jgi:AraC family transcriptional activator of tynA and feaB
MQPKLDSSLPIILSATTAGMCERDKFEYWHAVVCKAVVDLDPQPLGRAQFEASLSSVMLNDMAVSRIRASSHRVSRLPAAIARSGEGTLILNFVVQGRALVEQDGRTAHLLAGDGAVCDAERPYNLRFDETFEVASIKVPKALFAHSDSSLHRVTALSFAKIGHFCPLLYAYAASFSETASSLGAGAATKVFRNFSDLLRAALDEAVLSAPLPLSEYRATALMRVKEFIEEHVDDYELDAAWISAALSLSPRYINKLMEADGLSLSRYIWKRRVERAATTLSDPALKGESISHLAMRHGFNDLSHFSHAFRDRFGVSPRAFRSEALRSS